jgi:hypothetical protein
VLRIIGLHRSSRPKVIFSNQTNSEVNHACHSDRYHLSYKNTKKWKSIKIPSPP